MSSMCVGTRFPVINAIGLARHDLRWGRVKRRGSLAAVRLGEAHQKRAINPQHATQKSGIKVFESTSNGFLGGRCPGRVQRQI